MLTLFGEDYEQPPLKEEKQTELIKEKPRVEKEQDFASKLNKGKPDEEEKQS